MKDPGKEKIPECKGDGSDWKNIIGRHWGDLTPEEKVLLRSLENYVYTGEAMVWVSAVHEIERRLHERFPDEGP